ncbi:MAG: glucosaminidase domain-containing protein [Bacteroidia bacterium]|nr:glucosaminidase domain-containing protein [Bacteroidia bacterium]
MDQELILCTNEDCGNYLRTTSVWKPSRVWNNIFAVSFFIFFFILSFDDYSSTNEGLQGPATLHIAENKSLPLTRENLRKELDLLHVICAEQAYAQILIESGHLTSYLAKKTNNLLGMRYPFRRKTSAVGIFLPESNLIIKGTQQELKKYRNRNHYAVYANWQDCIADYKYWQDENFRLTDRYLTFLGDYYAEDAHYVAKIRNLTR